MAELIKIENKPDDSENVLLPDNSNENPSKLDKVPVLDSPKPLAFTIDFGERKSLDTNRFKNIFEKYQNRHKRVQSLSKIQSPIETQKLSGISCDKKPSSTNFPRKSTSDYHSEGYFSSDQEENKTDQSFLRQLKMLGLKSNVMNTMQPKNELTLPLQNTTAQRLKNNDHDNFDINCISGDNNEVVDLKDISSPEFDILTPSDTTTPVCMVQSMPEFIKKSPRNDKKESTTMFISFQSPPIKQNNQNLKNTVTSKPKLSTETTIINNFNQDVSPSSNYEIEDVDQQSDSISEAGTYTLDADNYTEEQKARMSIDKEINVAPALSPAQRTQHFVESTLQYVNNFQSGASKCKHLSPEDSLTQISIDGSGLNNVLVKKNVLLNNIESLRRNKNTNKILFASSNAKNSCGLVQEVDTGSFTSITTCGVFNRHDERRHHQSVQELSPETKSNSPRHNSLTKADVYVDIQSKMSPPSPTKIPSPIHSLSRPRSRASSTTTTTTATADLSDSSIETDCYLKRTQNCISTLQARLSSTNVSGGQTNQSIAQNILKNQTKHVRHNSYDSKNANNKLETFQSKIFHHNHHQNATLMSRSVPSSTDIDQTVAGGSGGTQQVVIATRSPTHKLYNSPNNSPIKRSSSFSVKQMSSSYTADSTSSSDFIYINPPTTTTRNVKESNLLRMSPNLNTKVVVHRSSSTASIKKHLNTFRNNVHQSSTESINQKRDKTNQLLIQSESSSEDEFGNNLFIRNCNNNKEVNITNTRHNRAFSLRRARLDLDPKCPNTPEMRRKFIQPPNCTPEPIKKFVAAPFGGRSTSIDARKPQISADVKSRYLNLAKNTTTATKMPNNCRSTVVSGTRSAPPSAGSVRSTSIARTDSGRFSMRQPKSKPIVTTPKSSNKKGNRSNSTLTSREVEFQNWKRRKSYDPMKAAAEGKQRKAELHKKLLQATNNGGGNNNNSGSVMTQSYTSSSTNQECDSSPSHSSSVHRSQSFHGTGGLDNYISSDEDLTLSAEEDCAGGSGDVEYYDEGAYSIEKDSAVGGALTSSSGSSNPVGSSVKQAWVPKNTRY